MINDIKLNFRSVSQTPFFKPTPNHLSTMSEPKPFNQTAWLAHAKAMHNYFDGLVPNAPAERLLAEIFLAPDTFWNKVNLAVANNIARHEKSGMYDAGLGAETRAMAESLNQVRDEFLEYGEQVFWGLGAPVPGRVLMVLFNSLGDLKEVLEVEGSMQKGLEPEGSKMKKMSGA